MSILIQHGTVIDGTGKKGYTADVLIDRDRIRAIGQIELSGEMQCVDASGCVVAPGFIDTHSHSDIEVLQDSRVLPKVMQVVTTEILGHAGISVAPLP